MQTPFRQSVPYHPDSAALFESLLDLPWAVFLDSGHPNALQGRYDILAADPMATITTRGQDSELRDRSGSRSSLHDPFQLLRTALAPQAQGFDDLPFCGGAIGYFGYDLARRMERLPTMAEDAERLPELAVGLYDWALVVDHERRQSWLVGQGRDPLTHARWDELVALCSRPSQSLEKQPLRVLAPVRSNMDRVSYAAGFERIQHYIRDGDCYQVNFAQRFSVPVEGEPWMLYRTLRRINAAPYAAYLDLPFVQVLSCSPERFLRVRGGDVDTCPIKGTAPRSADTAQDQRLAQELRRSAKNRAENLMIVDLLRNDLGKTCVPGSIEVPQLFQIESFATVHHLVSTVTGRLAEGQDALSLLRGCFPGGSITGAPKLRAMQIIEELEPQRRGIYCGSIGYWGFDGNADCNIAIRTLVHADGVLRFWAGGGIVADSVLEEEYQESYLKAEAMLRLLGVMQEAR